MITPEPLPSTYPALESILVSEDAIKQRVKSLGREIVENYGEDEEITIISILNGAILFTADLLREIPNPVRLDCIRIASYHDGTHSTGAPKVLQNFTMDFDGRHVLLVDDILDTGKTLSMVAGMLNSLKPASLKTCVLLDKKGRREVDFDADLVGFDIPNKFVVGYGLDFAERYRNFPCIGVLREDLQQS